MSAYDQKDFEQNEGKYRLFQTAVIAKHIVTQDAEDDLPEGTIVQIQFRCKARNQLFRRDEPVYRILNTSHTLYGNCLRDFVL